MKKIFAIIVLSLLTIGTFTSCATTKTSDSITAPKENPDYFYKTGHIEIYGELVTIGVFKTENSYNNCFPSFLSSCYGFSSPTAKAAANAVKGYNWLKNRFLPKEITQFLDNYKYVAYVDRETNSEFQINVYTKISSVVYEKSISFYRKNK